MSADPQRSVRWRGALGVTLLLGVGCAATTTPTTVYIVRHAEKASGDDPGLTERGHQRARALGEQLGGRGIDAVYATQFKRTQQTATPTATRAGLAVEVLDARATDELARRVRERHRGQRVLVAGHSNTVPSILRALGVAESVALEESEYGDLFVVRIDEAGAVTLRRERFGD